MRISEVVEKMLEIKERYGDIGVACFSNDHALITNPEMFVYCGVNQIHYFIFDYFIPPEECLPLRLSNIFFKKEKVVRRKIPRV